MSYRHACKWTSQNGHIAHAYETTRGAAMAAFGY
jgi:hypothetical protein